MYLLVASQCVCYQRSMRVVSSVTLLPEREFHEMQPYV